MRLTFDSNILVYAIDQGAGIKKDLATTLLAQAVRGDCVLTLQSLAEFYAVTVRKGKLPAEIAADFVQEWQGTFPVVAATRETLDAAIRGAREHRLSFWDAMLWATARLHGCGLLLSEDLQDGRHIGGVAIANPFLPHNDVVIAHALAMSSP